MSRGIFLGILELLVPSALMLAILSFSDALAIIVDRPGIRLLTYYFYSTYVRII